MCRPLPTSRSCVDPRADGTCRTSLSTRCRKSARQNSTELAESAALGELDEYSRRRRRMQKRDALTFGPDAGRLVDHPHPVLAATSQRVVEIVDGKADVMDAWATLGDKFGDRRIGGFCLEELDERLARGEPHDACTVGIGERNLGQPKHVTIERQTLGQPAHGDADVGNRRACGPRGSLFHVIKLQATETAGLASVSRSIACTESSCRTTE